MFGLGPQEMIVVAVLGVLLFGKRLPEVGRSLGKGIVEFKKGLRGIEEEFEMGSHSSAPSRRTEPSYSYEAPEMSVPKFEPPTTAPVAASEVNPQPYQD
jgi:sec-independent protein translocase protein TatA